MVDTQAGVPPSGTESIRRTLGLAGTGRMGATCALTLRLSLEDTGPPLAESNRSLVKVLDSMALNQWRRLLVGVPSQSVAKVALIRDKGVSGTPESTAGAILPKWYR